ncbi:MAG: DNA-protecting protein DprA [Actinobacteria bacterium]|nr:MAG: DNA-protecting protein DprA [Actinomycetota bacterium]
MSDVWRIGRGEPGYPRALLDLEQDVPAALFGCGSRRLVSELDPEQTVTIVGSRHPSGYGLEVAEELGYLLGAAGLVVVSGMALGIDSAVHRGVLAGNGSTIAVLGGGPDVVYPRSEHRLYERIVAKGAVISEMPSGTRPGPGAFPLRNRIMAALAKMTVVVEAAQPSGSLITAERARELGRDVGAVPGRVTSRVAKGTNALLKDGVAMVRDAQDVLDLLLGVGVTSTRRSGPRLEPELARVADAVDGGAATPDAVALAAGVDASEAAVALARLELMGYLRVDGAGRYERTSLTPPDEEPSTTLGPCEPTNGSRSA